MDPIPVHGQPDRSSRFQNQGGKCLHPNNLHAQLDVVDIAVAKWLNAVDLAREIAVLALGLQGYILGAYPEHHPVAARFLDSLQRAARNRQLPTFSSERRFTVACQG